MSDVIDELESELEARLRATLHSVALTVSDGAPKRRRAATKRTVVMGIAALAVTLTSAAFVVLNKGPDYVDRLPKGDVLVEGKARGTTYWLVSSFHKDSCGRPMPGVELLVASLNDVGREWNTGGIALEAADAEDDCSKSRGVPPRDPHEVAAGLMRLGKDGSRSSDWGLVAAVHRSVHALRVTVDGVTRDVPTVARPDAPNGVRYAVTALPSTTKTWSMRLVRADGSVLDCDARVPRPASASSSAGSSPPSECGGKVTATPG